MKAIHVPDRRLQLPEFDQPSSRAPVTSLQGSWNSLYENIVPNVKLPLHETRLPTMRTELGRQGEVGGLPFRQSGAASRRDGRTSSAMAASSKVNVILLDESVETFEFEPRSTRGRDLMAAVCRHLELREPDYFGLVVEDDGIKANCFCPVWIKPDRCVRKQETCANCEWQKSINL